jgi:primosomal protein N' (replication factor Y) (superfamily II helicase)
MDQSPLAPAPSWVAPVVAEPVTKYAMQPHQLQWVEVLVDCSGAQGLYLYQVPSDLQVQPGDILSVPFGAQQIGAIAIRLVAELPTDLDATSVRAVEDVVTRSFFPPHYWILLQQVAQYYYTPLIQVVRVALPPGLLGRSQRRIRLKPETIPAGAQLFLSPSAQQILERLQGQKHGDYTWQYLQRQVRGANRGLRELLQRGWVESYLEPPAPIRPKLRQAVTLIAQPPLTALSPRQQEVLDVLRRRGGDMGLQELLQICHTSSSVLKGLEQKGWIVIQLREVLRTETGVSQQPDQPKALTADQAASVAAIATLHGYTQVLLHGVTGSGKTEVYLQAIAPLLQQGQSALVLVPEIGLTPQLTDRFRARFGDRVQVYHSALSDGERYDTWRQMLSGTPKVVIGTRSAIFAPLRHLGLIILDEEHDSSFKQDQPAPCYHARTIAQWRSQLENCPLVLGSATPSLESWVVGKEERIKEEEERIKDLYLSLPHRIHSRPMPPIQIVDMRQELSRGNRTIFSQSLQQALQELQARRQEGKQGLLFIHRRGHSTFVSCRSCGYVMECPYCDISLAYHQPQADSVGFLRCHYCGFGRSHPSHCPDCSSPYLKHFGSGTQRVIQELTQRFPDLRCLRFDSDTTRTKGAHRALLSRFAQGEADLLVGTQMLTKGIDLPQVTLVGVIAADGLLHLADYRASERAFQTLVQVAGRAGRGDDPGQVIIQTYSPQHPVIQAVQQHDYEAFVGTELRQRSELGYPPYGRMILLRLSGLDATAVQRTAERFAEHLCSEEFGNANYELLGPAPAAVMRVARRYRWQLLLKCRLDRPSHLPNLMELRSLCPTGVSLTIDVDPLNLL